MGKKIEEKEFFLLFLMKKHIHDRINESERSSDFKKYKQFSNIHNKISTILDDLIIDYFK